MGNYFSNDAQEARHMTIIKSLEARISSLESEKEESEFHEKIKVKKVLMTTIQTEIKNHTFQKRPLRVLKPKNQCKNKYKHLYKSLYNVYKGPFRGPYILVIYNGIHNYYI